MHSDRKEIYMNLVEVSKYVQSVWHSERPSAGLDEQLTRFADQDDLLPFQSDLVYPNTTRLFFIEKDPRFEQ